MSEAMDLMDGITFDLENLRGTLGVCRVAAAASASGDTSGYALRDADLPDALCGAVAMLESIEKRIEQLYNFAKAARAGCVPDTIEARR